MEYQVSKNFLPCSPINLDIYNFSNTNRLVETISNRNAATPSQIAFQTLVFGNFNTFVLAFFPSF